MTKTIDYYYSLLSPWTYLGSPRLDAIAKAAGATINYRPVDLGKIFPVSGGLHLGARAPQRRINRMNELKRWRDFLQMPLTLEPKYFLGTDDEPSTYLVIAARESGIDVGPLTNAILRAVWVEERNVGDRHTLHEICADVGIDGDALLTRSEQADIPEIYAADTSKSIERNVFGAPTYIYEGELLWGQDRLDFLERAVNQ
ncbi:MAG: 2-hydroxychromene-2-carboxylate isomerase [Alphaproteobacteria bacterium]|jgi:2-hydroxychromene-2-carboxylate isomerase